MTANNGDVQLTQLTGTIQYGTNHTKLITLKLIMITLFVCSYHYTRIIREPNMV